MTPPDEPDDSPARTRLTPEQRRAAVLEATLPLLVEHGAGVTTRQIADAAGVAEGTLFRVFDDKKALLTAALARAFDPDPVIGALHAVASEGRTLEAVLLDVVEVLIERGVDMRGAMAVAHEMRRAAGDHGAAELARLAKSHADIDRAGSLAHAMHQLRSRAGRAPELIVVAVGDALAGHAAELRRDPAVCARILFSVVTSSFHDPLGPSEQLTAHEVVEVLLDGLRARPSTPAPASSAPSTPAPASSAPSTPEASC